jgi:hypothetical protein
VHGDDAHGAAVGGQEDGVGHAGLVGRGGWMRVCELGGTSPAGPVTGPGRQWRFIACAAILARPSGTNGRAFHFQRGRSE